MGPTEPAACPATLSTDKVRQVINRWSSSGFFRLPKMGDRVAIAQVMLHTSHTVRLWSEHEQRTVSRATTPYHGGHVDDVGTPPEPWSLAVAPPSDYEDRTETMPVPHTDCVQTCSPCGGGGRVTCPPCHGSGRIVCATCAGSGRVPQVQTRTEHNAQGMPVTHTETVHHTCGACGGGGRMICAGCGGGGTQVCSGCQGTGRVRTYDLLTVCFQQSERSAVLNATEVPEEQLRGASGKVLLVEEGPRVVQFSSVAPAVDERARALLHESQVESANRRLLFQRLRVEQVGVHEVRYRQGNGPTKQLWIFGDEEKVHAPGAPWAWGRVAAIVGGAVAVVAGVVVLLVFLWH